MKLAGRIALGILIFYAIACTTLLATSNPKAISIPDYHFFVSQEQGIIEMQGTWRLEDEKSGFPTQSTTLHCNKINRTCVEATAVVADSEIMMPVSLDYRTIEKWDEHGAIVRGADGMCFDTVYSISFAAKSVTGISQPRATAAAACEQSPIRKSERRGRFSGKVSN